MSPCLHVLIFITCKQRVSNYSPPVTWALVLRTAIILYVYVEFLEVTTETPWSLGADLIFDANVIFKDRKWLVIAQRPLIAMWNDRD